MTTSAFEFVPRGLRGWFPPSDERLWTKYTDDEDQLHEVESYLGESAGEIERVVLDRCRKNLDAAKRCLEQKPRWSTRYGLLFWRIIHEVDEDLLLVRQPPALAVEALGIRENFARNVTDETARATWLGPLDALTARLNAPDAPHDVTEEDRRLLCEALGMVNENADEKFRDLATTANIQLGSGLLVVVLFCITWIVAGGLNHSAFEPPITVFGAAALGAVGAILSNLSIKETVKVPYGQTWTSYTYYIVLIPVLGAISALVVLTLEHSHLLFELASTAQTPPQSTLVEIVVPGDGLKFARALLAVVAGFFGDRMIRSVMEKVRSRIFAEGSKDIARPVNE